MLPSEKSAFEKAWAACRPGHAMLPIRELSVDTSSALLYSPLGYDYPPVEVEPRRPSPEWTTSALREFVRGEFGSGELEATPEYPGIPDARTGRISREAPHHYLAECESSLVYGSYFQDLIAKTSPSDDMIDLVLKLLRDPKLCNRANARNIDDSRMREILFPLVKAKHRLRFVMPAFPFKDQNPFRTEASPWVVDMGEIALLIRLHTLVLALYQIHPHGADFVLISDGRAYADIFGISREDVEVYQADLLHWRNELNLERTVSIVDLADLTARSDTGGSGFSEVKSIIKQQLEELGSEADQDVSGQLATLRRGMTWNLALRSYVGQTSSEDLWRIAKGARPMLLEGVARSIAFGVAERAQAAAVEYAAFNLAIRFLDLFATYLPMTLRATIHAKPGQIAVPALGSVFPWNGVPVASSNWPRLADLKVQPLFEAGRGGRALVRHSLPGSSEPFLYSTSP